MKRPRKAYPVALACLALAGGLILVESWLRPRLALGRIRTDGITSYYVRSGPDDGHEGKLPAIIFIGHPHSSPFKDLALFKTWFDEPVLLIWSGVVSDIGEDRLVDDEAVWGRKRQQFPRLLDDYQRKLPVDEDRIYLTGFSFAGVYAWMLAYDHPELYAAVVPMSATSYPRQIQERLEAAKTLATVIVRGEKDRTPPRDLAAEMRTGKIVESANPGSRFVLKPGEGHRDMSKYWRENLQYVLKLHRKDTGNMTGSRAHTAAGCREAFLSWARRAAVPLPASPEQPLSERAQAALDRMLAGKRFVFLGEPDHCVIEKYPFRLTLIRHLFARGWRHVAMETGRSVGWGVDQYLRTGDESFLQVPSSSPQDAALHDKMLEFIDTHEPPFHEQLRRISESREKGTPRMRYWGYDLDLGVPLGSVGPIRSLLEGCTDSRIREALGSIDELADRSVDEQLARIEEMQRNLVPGEDGLEELRSWLSFLYDSVAAEKRPRMNRDPRGHRLWRAERERLMMRYLDQIVDSLGPDGRLILMGHNIHLSKEASRLRFQPQQSRFWGWRSRLRALAYEASAGLTRCPLDGGLQNGSVGSHLHKRFTGDVLSIWMLYGQGTLMMPGGPRTVRPHRDTIESLLAQVGDRFLLPLAEADPQAKAVLSNANLQFSWGEYVSADLTAQADAIYFVKDVNAE